MQDLNYNLLYRWFIGLGMDDPVWDPTTFTKNRDRLVTGAIAEAFLAAVLRRADAAGLLSKEHFSVDGTLLDAWASQKSFQRNRGSAPPDDEDPGNPSVNFRGERRSKKTHASTSDPDARLARKGKGKEAKLSYQASILVDNRHGLVVQTVVGPADGGLTEVEQAVELLTTLAAPDPAKARTVGGDKGYAKRVFVEAARALGFTPHVAQDDDDWGAPLDMRTTPNPGYAVSPRCRKKLEEGFGWERPWGPCGSSSTAGLSWWIGSSRLPWRPTIWSGSAPCWGSRHEPNGGAARSRPDRCRSRTIRALTTRTANAKYEITNHPFSATC